MRHSQTEFYEAMSSKDSRCINCEWPQEDHLNGACVDVDAELDKDPEEEELEEWELDGTPEDADWIKERSTK